MMVANNTDRNRTGYAITVDYKHGESHHPWVSLFANAYTFLDPKGQPLASLRMIGL